MFIYLKLYVGNETRYIYKMSVEAQDHSIKIYVFTYAKFVHNY